MSAPHASLTNEVRKVPAKSVAIALDMCSVYPWESPGGWNLLGRTPVVLFDPAQTEQPAITSTCRPDGRRARSDRTRTKIIEAYIALLRTGDRIPQTPDVARRANCCVRTLYQHFGTLSQLNEAAAAHIQQAGSISVRAAGSLEERVRIHTKWCAESWERWLPLYSAGGAADKSGGF